MMKKILLLFCMAAILLCGCGRNETDAISSDISDTPTTQTITGQVQAIQGQEVTLLLGKLRVSETAGQNFTPGQTTQNVTILSNLAITMPDGTDGILTNLSVGDVLEVTLDADGRVKAVTCCIQAQGT
jgi:hypothetical protein